MRKVQAAVGWSAVDVVVRNGVGFGVTIILARLLTPEDFGTIAILGIFLGIATLFIDGGFGEALIQSRSVTHKDESSVFFFNLAMGALISILLCLLAPWIASFYGLPNLRAIIVAMALRLFVSAFGSIHNALLMKKLEFSVIATVGGVSTVISGISGVTAALAGLGVWSLVIQAWTASVVTVILFWWLHSWRPALTFDSASIRRFFRFSGWLLVSGFMYQSYGNVYSMVIGKVHTAQDAGFYGQAHRLQQLVATILTRIVARVAFPAFSAANTDEAKLRRGMSKALTVTMFASVPMALSMSLFAEPIVRLLFGAQWFPAVPVLQVLGLSAMFVPMQMINISMLKALGRSDLNVRVMAIKFVSGLALLFLASPYGIVAIAWAFVVSYVFNLFVNTHYTRVLLDYGTIRQLREVVPYILAALPMIGIAYLFQSVLGLQHLELLVTALPAGLVGYLLMCRLFRLKALEQIVGIVSRRASPSIPDV